MTSKDKIQRLDANVNRSHTSLASSDDEDAGSQNGVQHQNLDLAGGLVVGGGMKKGVSTISLSTIHEDGEEELYGNFFEYILSCIGFAVGLGNIWRFPKILLENGGGAFLIPYFVILFIEGIPIMMLELTIGQRFRSGPVHAYGRVNKYLWGLGVGMAMASFFCSLYYNTILAWGFIYFFNSFQRALPWSECSSIVRNKTECEMEPAEYYFKKEVVNTYDNFGDTFEPTLQLYWACLIAWLVVYMCIAKGVKSSGKVVYFTCLFPYFVMTLVLIIGASRTGAINGLKFIFTPDFSKIWQPSVWMAAMEQIFFSAGIGFGGMISMSSCMPIKNKTWRDAFLILGMNSFTSLFAASGIFCIKGHMAYQQFQLCVDNPREVGCIAGASIMDYVAQDSSGSGLIFVTMAKAVNIVAEGYGAITLSLVLYLMVITLGLDSAFGTIDGYLPVFKELPFCKLSDSRIVQLFIGISAAASIIFCSNYGEYFIDLFDKYGCVLILVYLGFFELVAVWIYGMKNLDRDFMIMNGRHVPIVIKLCLMYITPFLLLAAIITNYYNQISEGTVFIANGQLLPWWGVILAVFIFVMGAFWVPGGAVITWLVENKLHDSEGNKYELDWGHPEFDYAALSEDIRPTKYSKIERFLFRTDEYDFPENLVKDDDEDQVEDHDHGSQDSDDKVAEDEV